jgi:hypothetical protein
VQVIGVLAEETNLAGGDAHRQRGALRVLRSVPVTGDETFVKVQAGAGRPRRGRGHRGRVCGERVWTPVLADSYAQRQRLTGGALQLLQGFMALGLLVGIAALGVISTRAVIERRQQVGMLRALGYQRGMVGLSLRAGVELCLDHRAADRRDHRRGAGRQPGDSFLPADRRNAVTIPWLQIALIVLAPTRPALLAADDDPAGMAGGAHLPGGGAAV